MLAFMQLVAVGRATGLNCTELCT